MIINLKVAYAHVLEQEYLWGNFPNSLVHPVACSDIYHLPEGWLDTNNDKNKEIVLAVHRSVKETILAVHRSVKEIALSVQSSVKEIVLAVHRCVKKILLAGHRNVKEIILAVHGSVKQLAINAVFFNADL